MALIKLTAIVDNISGKLNGTVFAKNKGGHYMRSKSMPSNPRSTFQTAVRARFGAIAQLWGALTQAQRNAWNAMASEFPYTNRLGDTKILSGFALHQKLNTNLAVIGQNPLSAPPQPVSPQAVIRLEVSASQQERELMLSGEMTSGAIGVDTDVVVMATPPLRDGVDNFDTQLREIGVIEAGELRTGTNVMDLYAARFGSIQQKQKIGVSVHTVAVNSGIASAAVNASTIVRA